MGLNFIINNIMHPIGFLVHLQVNVFDWYKYVECLDFLASCLSFFFFSKNRCCFFKYMLLLHTQGDNSFQLIIDIVLSLTLGCSSWMHLTSCRHRIYLHDLRTWYVECFNFLMMLTSMFWWIGLMKHNSVVMKPLCVNSWVKSLWSR